MKTKTKRKGWGFSVWKLEIVASEVAKQLDRSLRDMTGAVDRVLCGDFQLNHPVDAAILAALRRHRVRLPAMLT